MALHYNKTLYSEIFIEIQNIEAEISHHKELIFNNKKDLVHINFRILQAQNKHTHEYIPNIYFHKADQNISTRVNLVRVIKTFLNTSRIFPSQNKRPNLENIQVLRNTHLPILVFEILTYEAQKTPRKLIFSEESKNERNYL